MSSYQYDAPLTGPERVKARALELAMGRTSQTTGTPEQKAEAHVAVARIYERYMRGGRATGVQARIDEAYELAIKLLADGERSAHAVPPTHMPVDKSGLQELVMLLSRLTAGPPF